MMDKSPECEAAIKKVTNLLEGGDFKFLVGSGNGVIYKVGKYIVKYYKTEDQAREDQDTIQPFGEVFEKNEILKRHLGLSNCFIFEREASDKEGAILK